MGVVGVDEVGRSLTGLLSVSVFGWGRWWLESDWRWEVERKTRVSVC